MTMHGLFCRWFAGLAVGALTMAYVSAQPTANADHERECGPLVHPKLQPRDYRTARKDYIYVVENRHFPPHVELLMKAVFKHIATDIGYTLYAFPNHPRALNSLARLGEREKTDQPPGLPYTIDCFFRRAVILVPDDLIVRMLYAQYLNKQGRRDAAIGQLKYVELSVGDVPMTHYNLGLMYFEVGEYDLALRHAHRAAELGVERQELRAQLVSAGRWSEPGVAASTASGASAPDR